MTTISMRQKDIRPAPARIEFKGMKFLITDRPSDTTIQSYLMVCKMRLFSLLKIIQLSLKFSDFLFIFLLKFKELQKHNVTTVVRVCEPSYKKDALENAGIEVLDLYYEDGTFPPPNIVDDWFDVLKQK
jgi:protein tyrosine phosphatase type IVA